jgi:hypothetical protein
MNVYRTYTRPLSVRAQYSRNWPIISSSCYNSSLVTWTVVCLTAAKFKPLIFKKVHISSVALYILRTDHAQKNQFYSCLTPIAQKTSHVVHTQQVFWRAACCPATSYKYPSYWDTTSIIARFNVFTEPLADNALIQSSTAARVSRFLFLGSSCM